LQNEVKNENIYYFGQHYSIFSNSLIWLSDICSELSYVDLEDQNSRWTKYLKKDTVVDKKSFHIIPKLPKTMPQLIASMKAEKNKKEDFGI
jgi:hypothetical protein